MDFGGPPAIEGGMRPAVRVADKGGPEPALHLMKAPGSQRTDPEIVLECPPESFDERDRTVLAESPEAVTDAGRAKSIAKHAGGELFSLIGDEVPGRAVPRDGCPE